MSSMMTRISDVTEVDTGIEAPKNGQMSVKYSSFRLQILCELDQELGPTPLLVNTDVNVEIVSTGSSADAH
jgi:hypothetical protein